MFYSGPVAGVVGGIMIGPTNGIPRNDLEIPATTWTYDIQQRPVAIPSMKSWPYQDVLAGGKIMTLSASGVCRTNFNPFAAPAIKLGATLRVRLFVEDTVVAGCARAFIAQWIYENNADGTANWTMQATGNWTFTDFSRTNA